MNKIIVDPELLELKSQKIQELNEQYQALFNRFNNDIDTLASVWKGNDNITFTSQIKGFNDDFKMMYMIINQYTNFLSNSARAYRDTQNELISQVKGLNN